MTFHKISMKKIAVLFVICAASGQALALDQNLAQ